MNSINISLDSPINNSSLVSPYLFLKEKSDIVNWLEAYKIKNYEIVTNDKYGWVVDVQNDVFLSNMNLEYIPMKFNIVEGNFDCSRNNLRTLIFAPSKCINFDCTETNLISLEGCPSEIEGDFDCGHNALASLENGPVKVGGAYRCAYNRLKSLKGVPRFIKEDFACSSNPLKSLMFGPKSVGWDYIAINCSLVSLEYFPSKVGSGYMYISQNEALGSIQAIYDFRELKEISFNEKIAKKEKRKLAREIKSVEMTQKSSPENGELMDAKGKNRKNKI